jgi:HAMP domain-containing protein
LDEEIGLQDDGLKGKLDKDFSLVKKKSQAMIGIIMHQKENYERNSSLLLVMLFFLQLVAGVVLAIFYSDQITRSVKELRQAIGSFANGKFPPPLRVKSHEEIGQTKQDFNQLLDRIRAAQDFSLAMGEGNLANKYREEFKDDLLAKALIKTQQELKRAHDEQEIFNWTNRGLVQLNDILKAQDKDLVSLGDDIVKMLVRYLDMNQGALYVVHTEGERSWAERVSTYAYGKRKVIEQRIDAGQGLIGQCLLEKSSILLTQIPKDYVKITSGLGAATPSFIQITPLIVRDKVIGIIELASFQKLEKFKSEFIETMARNIAIILKDKNDTLETRRLLEASRAYAQRLASQEEEIKQNAEEMQAITEQLEREKKQLQSEIEILKSLVKNEMVKN